MTTRLHAAAAEPTLRTAANDAPAGRAAAPDVRMFSLVDLLAEAFVAKMVAANDDRAPTGES